MDHSSSSSVTSSPNKTEVLIGDTLELSEELFLEDVQRLEIDIATSPTKPRINKSEKTHDMPKKQVLYHPKLYYVMGEMVHSPYLVSLKHSYPSSTLEIPEKLYELKRKSPKLDALPKELHPFDLSDVKKKFMKEVINYRKAPITELVS